MHSAVVIGATGLIGTNLIHLLNADGRYKSIKALVRNSAIIDDGKVKYIAVDFKDPRIDWDHNDELFCCLGTTIKAAGSKEKFYEVDHNYVLNIAKLAKANGVKKICLISSMGADSKSMVFYNRVKGEVENDIIALGFETCFIIRPSLLLGKRNQFRFGESIGKFFMTLFSFVIPSNYKAVKGSAVAKKMVQLINSGITGTHIINSGQIRD